MRIKGKKLMAFTLSEMIVVLLITTIVVGMAFGVLQLVQKQMQGIQGNYERNTELNLLRQSLWIDFNTYERVYYDGKQGELLFENPLGQLRYQIEENNVIKGRDTFDIKWKSQKFYFENIERSLGEIDAINFETTMEMGNRTLFVYKNNGATTYLNH